MIKLQIAIKKTYSRANMRKIFWDEYRSREFLNKLRKNTKTGWQNMCIKLRLMAEAIKICGINKITSAIKKKNQPKEQAMDES